MRHINLESCPDDLDVLMRPAMKANGSSYYEYILLYTDDVIVKSENAEDILNLHAQDKFKMPCKTETPMKPSYRPELHITPELDPIKAAYYMHLIGILRWMVGLGRVNICLKFQ